MDSPSRIPHFNSEKANPLMKQSSNCHPVPAAAVGQDIPKCPPPRRAVRRCTAVSYQGSPQQQDTITSYLPPPQPIKSSPYSSPRANNSKQSCFERDFGPFGAVPHRNMKDDVSDIASMFRRSDTRTTPCLLQQQMNPAPNMSMPGTVRLNDGAVHVSHTINHAAGGGRIAAGAGWQTEIISEKTNGNLLLRSSLPPPNQPTVIGGGAGSLVNHHHGLPAAENLRNLSRKHEDVDMILNKYGSRSSKSNLREVEKDPDFTQITPEAYLTNAGRYCKQNPNANQVVHNNNNNNYWDDQQQNRAQDFMMPQPQPQRRRNIQGKSPEDNTPDHDNHSTQQQQQKIVATTTYLKQLHPAQQIIAETQTQQQQNQFICKPTTHVFPFKEVLDGQLIIDPCQIAFESRKLAVLMSDPNNNTTIEFSTNKSNGSQLDINPSTQERILHEVKRAMSMSETSDAGRPRFHGLSKEINPNYSTSTKATEEFESRILKRVIAGRNADTHVMIGDKIFPCHSIVLEAFSAYFDRLTRPQDYIQKIFLPEMEVPSESFPIVMDWIMKSEEARKNIPKKDNLVAVYIAAKTLGIKELETQCLSFMEKNVDSNDPDLMKIWNEIKKRQSNCCELVTIAASKMAASYQDIFETKKYLQMDVDELCMLLSSDDISISSEMEVYTSAITWLLHDWKTRKVHTNKIMGTVRFGLLSPLQLTQISFGPEITKVKNEKEYNQVLAYGNVKSMIDEGLAYSILEESYKTQPEELRKWVEKSAMKIPPPRTFLQHKKPRVGGRPPLIIQKIDEMENTSQTTTRVKPSPPRRPLTKSSSYTLMNVEPKAGTPTITSTTGFHETVSTPNTGTEGEKGKAGSKSRIPTIASNSGPRPSPGGSTNNDKGNKRPASYQYQAEPNTVVHELSKPKLLTNSSNILYEVEPITSNEERPATGPPAHKHRNPK